MLVAIIILAVLLVGSILMNFELYNTILDYREKEWENQAIDPIQWDYIKED